MTEPTTAESLLKIHQARFHAMQPHGWAVHRKSEEDCHFCALIADVEALTKERGAAFHDRESLKRDVADSAAGFRMSKSRAESAEAKLEQAREKVGELQFTAMMGQELDEADRHLRRIEELATTFLKETKP